MNQLTLYSYSYIDDENGDLFIDIYKGILLPNTPSNPRKYPIVRILGIVNLTKRFFLKYRKDLSKVDILANEHLRLLNAMELQTMRSQLLEFEYDEEFITLLTNVIHNSSNNKKIMNMQQCMKYGIPHANIPEEIPIRMRAITNF